MIYSSNHDSLTFFVERVFALRFQWTISAHTATRRRTHNDGLQKQSSNSYTRRTILYIVPDLSISVQFRVCRHQPEPLVSPTLLRGPGQSQLTIEGRRATRLRTWPACAARPARASRPGLATGLDHWNHSFRRSRY